MNHSFDIAHAASYGIEEAILISNFQHWINHNKANGTNFKEGRTWTYNSVKAFAELFPYMTTGKIRRALEHLVAEGVLLQDNHNPNKVNQTKWYAFADEDAFLLPSSHLSKTTNGSGKTKQSHLSKPANAIGAGDKSLISTDINAVVNTDTAGAAVPLLVSSLPDWLTVEAWNAWVEYRNHIKAPLTEHAAELCIKRLEKLKTEGNDPVEVIEQSIMSGKWNGLFPIKEETRQGVFAGNQVNAKGRPLNKQEQIEQRCADVGAEWLAKHEQGEQNAA